MNTKYGYFSVNQNLQDLWEQSRKYWRSQKKVFIKHESSYTTEKFGKMDLSKRRSIKQSEEYKIYYAQDQNDPNITYVRIFFEYYGDAFLGATKRMERMINKWINQFNVDPIIFHKKPIKEYEIFFTDIIEYYELIAQESNEIICPFCGKKNEGNQNICQYCGSDISST